MNDKQSTKASPAAPTHQGESGSDAAAGLTPPSAPSGDPCALYPSVPPRDLPPNDFPKIDCAAFQLPPEGLDDTQRRAALEQMRRYVDGHVDNFMGYQANQKEAYSEDLAHYLDCSLNNVGDPFESGNFNVNSKFMERAVLDYFASLWNARWPSNPEDPESYWGYVVSMGASEGNLYGLWNGRDYLAGRQLLEDPNVVERIRALSKVHPDRIFSGLRRLIWMDPVPDPDELNGYTPICFYSEDTHYSIIKAMRVLGIKTFYEVGTAMYRGLCPIAPPPGAEPGTWPEEVPSDANGAIDIEALAALVEFFARQGYPILVCFNYGTTFRGAYDDVEAAGNALMPILERYGLYERNVDYGGARPSRRHGFWFHVDAALGAAYMPFIEMAHAQGKMPERGPNFDFRLPFVSSISMSSHKWIGAPFPGGVFMTKRKYQLTPPDDPAYIGSSDSTFAGSRNGMTAAVLWDYLARNSQEALVEKARHTEDLAKYAHARLAELERELEDERGKGWLWLERGPLALTVLFRRANETIVYKYSLSGETILVDGEERDINHIFMMDHVTEERIDRLVEDLRQPGAFPSLDDPPATAGERCDHLQERLVQGRGKRLALVPHTGRGFR